MSCSADGDEASPMVELSEWENINRRQGCGAVHVSPRDELSGNGSCGVQGGSALTPGGVILDPQASLELRAAIRSLVDDSERRQILIHGLIQCNSRLKNDVRLQQDRAGRQERRAEELQRILDDIKAKIRDLEDDFFCKTREQQSEVTRLREEQEGRLERCQKQEQSIAQLRARITRAEAAEQKRLQDGRKSFQHLLRRLPQHNSPLHQQILDVVDGYESQVKQLQDEIRRLSVDGGHSGGSLNLDTTPNYKALIKSYQEQIQEARRKEEALQRESERLQRENERLQLEVKAREFRVYKQQTRKMEKILAQNNLRCGRRFAQRSSGVSPHVLQALVSHFQKLFDVPSVSGVFPKMNKVYMKVGEMDNVLKTLRCLLGLGVSARAEVVVNAVGRLCRETGGGCSLPQILGTLDLDSVINKVQEHEQFFPAFEELIKDLLDLLEITHLEEIVPEVQRLKEVR